MSDTPKASPEISPASAPTSAQEQGALPVAPDVVTDAPVAATAASTPQQPDGERKPDEASPADAAQASGSGDSAAATATSGGPDSSDTAAPPVAQAGDSAEVPAVEPAESAQHVAEAPKAPGSNASPALPDPKDAHAVSPDAPVAAPKGTGSKDESSTSTPSESGTSAAAPATETPPAQPASEAAASVPASPTASADAPAPAPSASSPETTTPSAASPHPNGPPNPTGPADPASLTDPTAQSVTPPPASPTPGSPMLRILLRVLAALVLLALLACGYAGYDAWRFLHTPPASPGADVYVDVEPGATFDRVTKQLVDKGAVTSDWRFKLLAHYHRWETSLKAGRFLVHSGWTPFRVLDQLVNGQPVLSRITLREGLTWWETARLLEVEGFVTVEDFRAVITDPAFLRHWGIPFDTAEGFLFPDTYLIKKPPVPDRESARAVAGRMVDTFWRRASQVWPDGRPARDELRRLVILASIVEKETGQPSERGRVAGVYANRLRTGMLLQADPTTIYGLGDTFDGNLRRPHLQDAANPYNTYRRPGLPPGPICSPGLESLRAATTPEKHGYFYFVSRNDGSHQFSATLDEHNRAVNRFQRGGRARGADQATTQGTPATPVNPTDAAAATGTPASTGTTGNAPKMQDKDTTSSAGDKAAEPGTGTAGDAAPGVPDANAVKPAPAPLPRGTAPAGNASTGANATVPTNAGVRAPVTPREAAQSAPPPLTGQSTAGGTANTASAGAASATAPTATAAQPAPANSQDTPPPAGSAPAGSSPTGAETPAANATTAP